MEYEKEIKKISLKKPMLAKICMFSYKELNLNELINQQYMNL